LPWKSTASSPSCASKQSITRSSAFRKRRCATTSVGAAGTVRILTTCRWNTSLIWFSRLRRRPIPSRPAKHEWRAWQAVKVPPGKILMPGVVSHATNLVEHPQLVADRILRYTAIVGRENVIAGTDCGLGGRVHSELAWAKLRALVEGAQLASKNLWRR